MMPGILISGLPALDPKRLVGAGRFHATSHSFNAPFHFEGWPREGSTRLHDFSGASTGYGWWILALNE
jgi:hypothetical protein